MTDDDSKLVDIFMEAQARPIGRSFSENILAGIRAVLAYRSTEASREGEIRLDEAQKILQALDGYGPASDYGPPLEGRIAMHREALRQSDI